MMNSSLNSMLRHYLPNLDHTDYQEEPLPSAQATDEPPSPGIAPEATNLLLASTEIHENNYSIISYGCSINVHEDQSIWTQRLDRCGLQGPQITTLSQQNWQNQESYNLIQTRFVAELSQRVGTYPRDVSIHTLSKKLNCTIPTSDVARDRREPVDPRLVDEEDLLRGAREFSGPITGREKLYRMDEEDKSFDFNAVSLKRREREEKIMV